MTAGTPKHDAAKLKYPTSDKVSGIDVEFLQTQESLSTYLCVHSVRLKERSQGFLIIDGTSYPLHAHVRQGGQKMILSEESSSLLTESLLQGKSVEIRLPEGYRAILSPIGFREAFERLQDHSSFKNPFHHPF